MEEDHFGGVLSRSTVPPSTLTPLQCFLPGATFAPILSTFKLAIIVAGRPLTVRIGFVDDLTS